MWGLSLPGPEGVALLDSENVPAGEGSQPRSGVPPPPHTPPHPPPLLLQGSWKQGLSSEGSRQREDRGRTGGRQRGRSVLSGGRAAVPGSLRQRLSITSFVMARRPPLI